MAKISISLPDSLKERVNAYAQAHDQSVSLTVQRAIEQLLNESPATSIDPLVRNYLQNLVLQVELMRRSMQNAMLPVPPPLPAPPWYPKMDNS